MGFIKAHLFESIEAAKKAVQLININQGLSIESPEVTSTYCEIEVDRTSGQHYIVADEITINVIGDAIELELRGPNLIL